MIVLAAKKERREGYARVCVGARARGCREGRPRFATSISFLSFSILATLPIKKFCQKKKEEK